ncbi:MAG: hypothetical protein GVY34_03345 [Alphaproteobacteria bacterium]|jgi:HPt (histidine-containing phosphotransfer) domain-containing protein|nr:hypothetical protein [Alphaproteobacteria bacterium]
MGGPEMRAALVTQVRHDLDRCRTTLLTATAEPGKARDHVSICKAAHGIKGLAVTVGALALADLAREVEKACQTRDTAKIDKLLARLATETGETSTALAQLASAD